MDFSTLELKDGKIIEEQEGIFKAIVDQLLDEIGAAYETFRSTTKLQCLMTKS